MATSINWITGVITVLRADMELVQLNPVEIRRLDTNAWRVDLRDLEDDEDGRPWPKTHNHNADVSVGGVVLADVFVLLDPYTITFEDGQYAVYLVGTNNNILEKTNKNQVSVNPSNSAGLISTPLIEYDTFQGAVHIDSVNGVAGTLFPIGTPLSHVNNLADAKLIAAYRGFTTLHMHGDFTFGATDNIDGFKIIGTSRMRAMITITAGCSTEKTIFEYCGLEGTLDGKVVCYRVGIGALAGFDGVANTCVLSENTITLIGSSNSSFIACKDGAAGLGTPTINMGGSGRGLGIWGYHGGIKIINKTGNEEVSVNIDVGRLVIDSTVTDGAFIVRCIGKLEDNSTGTTTVDSDGVVSQSSITETNWDLLIDGSDSAQDVLNEARDKAKLAANKLI